MNALLAVGVLIIVGFFGGMAANKIKFPKVSGYIVVGMLLGPSFLNIISKEVGGGLDIIVDIALGVIAYVIGGSLEIGVLRKLKKDIAWISLLEALGAWIFVTSILLFIGPFIISLDIKDPIFIQTYLPLGLIVGAVSLATAPGATVAIIREYKAKGPLTTTLLAVVTLDDAYAIMVTSVALSIAAACVMGISSISLYQMLLIPIIEIMGSILMGLIFGMALKEMSRFTKEREILLTIVFGMIMLATGIAKYLNLSYLLVNMAMGFIVVNKMGDKKDMFGVINDIEGVIFAAFFTLAGAHLDLEILKVAWPLALVLIVGSFSGKLIGARIGATISGASPAVKKYLGLGLLPKAGVTVGLILLANQNPAFQSFGTIMVNGVLGSVVIDELLAPPLVKYALFKSGEASQ